uniref:DUF5683 domain-containing protein n=1 Tax=candidate division WOR-3 bacterium TaxID=2052148 RepID=A0A7C6A8I0_UNCW3
MNRWFFLFLLTFTFNSLFATSDSIHPTEAKKNPTGQNKFDKSPGKAMLLSAILPGAGQFYTENYLKGGIITLAWGTLGFLSIREHQKALNALSVSDTNTYKKHRDQRNNFLWWTAAVWVFSLADAYVSSHMYKFKGQETLSAFGGFKINCNLKIEPELTINFTLKKSL